MAPTTVISNIYSITVFIFGVSDRILKRGDPSKDEGRKVFAISIPFLFRTVKGYKKNKVI